MKRYQTLACYFLIASAFVLAGMLTLKISDRSAAQAEMVVQKDIFTVLTAEGISGEQFVYALDNKNEVLLCYAMSSRGQIELYAALDVAGEMNKGLEAWEQATGRR